MEKRDPSPGRSLKNPLRWTSQGIINCGKHRHWMYLDMIISTCGEFEWRHCYEAIRVWWPLLMKIAVVGLLIKSCRRCFPHLRTASKVPLEAARRQDSHREVCVWVTLKGSYSKRLVLWTAGLVADREVRRKWGTMLWRRKANFTSRRAINDIVFKLIQVVMQTSWWFNSTENVPVTEWINMKNEDKESRPYAQTTFTQEQKRHRNRLGYTTGQIYVETPLA